MSRPDEGLIHAWLDGELDAAEAARVEALVKSDPGWAAAAAEARGFIAASARILGALDDVPANVVPRAGASNPNGPAKPAGDGSGGGVRTIPSGRPAKRGTPWWAMRAAAVLVIVAGTAVVLTRGGVRGVETDTTAPVAQQPPAQAPATALTEMAKGREPAAAPGAGNAPVAVPPQAKPRAPEAANKAAGGKAPTVSSLDKTSLAETDVARRKDAAVLKGTAVPTAPAPTPTPTPTLPPSPSAKVLADERVAATGAVAPSAAKATNEVAARRAAPTPVVASAGAASSLRQAAAPPAAAAAGAADAPVTTGAADNLAIACYRDVTTSPGDVAIVHRVVRTSDSTAVPVLPAEPRRDAPGFRAEAQAMRPVPLAVRNDTLVLGIVDGRVRYALRVSCPQP